MMRWKGFVAVVVCSFALTAGSSGLLAQDPEEPAEPTPTDTEDAQPATPATPPPPQSTKRYNGIYVSAGWGNGTADDMETSLDVLSTSNADSSFEIDEMNNARASLGWRMAEGKGDWRINYSGYEEDSYKFNSVGLQQQVLQPGGNPTECKDDDGTCVVPWWNVSIDNGVLHSTRTPPVWDSLVDDANGDGLANPGEIRLNGPSDIDFMRDVADSMQNQISVIDIMYGREFGGRRYSSHWWAGIRSFEYDGNVLAGSWMNFDFAGVGFTDGAFLRLLTFNQEASGYGPSGAWEIDFNFFDKGLQIYLLTKAAFTFSSIESDSGDFFTLVRSEDVGLTSTFVPAETRLTEDRDKSTWQTGAEVGARVRLRNGLQFELGYSIEGYLDVALFPVEMTIPANAQQAAAGASAIYKTHDIVIDSFHAGVAFQFGP